MSVEIRLIQPNDNKIIASIIKSVLTELNYNLKGTAFYDKETDNMFEAYQSKRSVYYVAILNNEIIGGCGINQLNNENSTICELQKMYLLPSTRGKGIGQQLISKCIDFAKKTNYKICYLETFPKMLAAIHLYEKNGFYHLKNALGDTCHYACNIWMQKDL